MRMNKKIIVFGNETNICSLLEKFINKQNILFADCLYFSMACSLISQKKPAVIIIEVVPPYFYGANLLFHLRQQHPELSVLIISKNSGVFSKETAYGLGANAYLAEPFTEQQFIELLIGLLKARKVNIRNGYHSSEVQVVV